jgi:phage N-6-adenine-methyltransferase
MSKDIISSNMAIADRNSWSTPDYIYKWLNSLYNFDIDLCASKENAKVLSCFLTKETDALKQDWSDYGYRGFINPPYGRGEIANFIEKAIEQAGYGFTTVFLIPNAIESKWLDLDQAERVIFITGGRLSFVHPITGEAQGGNTKGSMIVVYSEEGLEYSTEFYYEDRDSIKEQYSNDTK